MDALEELERLATLKALLDEKAETLIQLDAIAKKVTSAMGGEVVQRSRNLDPMGDAVALKEKLTQEIKKIQCTYTKQLARISRLIDKTQKPVFIKILYGLYVNGRELGEVADKIGYSYRHTQNLRDDAIKEIQKIMDKRKKIS